MTISNVNTPTVKHVIYRRVSTREQGRGGLGMLAQSDLLSHFLTDCEVVAEFVEVASGKHADRPELRKAVDLCVENGYHLAVAKVDRLSRVTEHALMIREELDGRLFCCDIPMKCDGTVDKFTFTLYMAFADRERELISVRTKQALDRKKAEQGEWRRSGMTDEHRRKGGRVVREAANRRNVQLTDGVVLRREKGMTLQQIADEMNAKGILSPRGKKLTPTTVSRLLKAHDRQVEQIGGQE